MDLITSKSNPKIVQAKKLLQKKYRDEVGLFLVETKKVIQEAISAGISLQSLFVLNDNEVDFLSEIDLQNVSVFHVSNGVFKDISSTVTPDGFVAVSKKNEIVPKYQSGPFLLLDNLQNPDNFGAILRTAVATNFKQIFCINCVDEYNPKVLRASMGNQFKLNISHIAYDDVPKLFANAKLYAMSMEGENLFGIETFSQNIGFVIGNEGNGVSQTLRKYVQHTLSIPMENGIESLNASVSAGVVMYYVYSKCCK